MQPFDEAVYRELADSFGQRVKAHAPDWTGGNDSDPGITLVELFAFVAETLLYRANQIPERGRASAARLAGLALALAARTDAGGTIERPRYYYGQVLGADDFTLEQDYVRHRLRRHQRELHGYGIVHGLAVSVERTPSGSGAQVVVAPGLALDRNGEEIEVTKAASATLPALDHPLYVVLLHAERPSRPQPSAGGGSEFSRIEEGYALSLEATDGGNGVPLVRLLRSRGLWRVDKAFRPGRVGR
jgi:hypothetical protein